MIGIIGAMQTEVELLISQIEEPKKENISGIDFFSGKICGKAVVVARCGIGKVFAALCAESMILRYNVELIINTGVGGSLSNGLDIGDIAISDFVLQHDMDTSALGDPVGLISGINIIKIPADKALVEQMRDTAKNMGYRHIVGTVASGDKFVSSRELKDNIAKTFGASVCEMEGAAIGQVCYVNSLPFCVVRAVSDKADGSAELDYPTFVSIAAEKNARLVLEFIKNKQ